MSLTTLLWFLSTLLALWGATLFIRGLRGERVQLRNTHSKPSDEPLRPSHARPPWKPTWGLMLAGLVVCGGGLTLGWWSIGISNELAPRGRGDVTQWHAVAAGVGVFSVMLIAWGLFGDRSRGRRRCPRCWYDLGGLTLENLPATCAECGRSIPALRDLHRTRRHKKITSIGVAILLLGGGGLIVMGRPGGPASLVPNRALAWLAFQGRTPDRWVRDELDRRTETDDRSLARHLARTWIDRTLTGDIETTRISTPWVAEALQQRPNEHAEAGVTIDELHKAWNTQCGFLIDQLINGDQNTRSWISQYSGNYNQIFMTLIADADPTENPDGIENHPAARFGVPELSPANRDALSRAFIDEPINTRAVAFLFGPEGYRLFGDELHQVPNNLTTDARAFHDASIALGFSIAVDEDASREAIAMLGSDDSRARLFAAQSAVFTAGIAPDSLSPELIKALRGQLDSDDARVRFWTWRALSWIDALTVQDFVRLSLRTDLTDDDLFQLFATGDQRRKWLPDLDRLVLADNLTRNGSLPIPLNQVIGYLKYNHAHDPAAIPILRRLSESLDPLVATQARDLLEGMDQATQTAPPDPTAEPSPDG